MGAVAAGLVGIFIFLIVRFSQPQLETLFAELQVSDSASIVRQLETMNVPYEIRNEGATILVPKERVLRLRMSLAEEGIPAGRTVGYEIFDKTGTMGATSFVQNINHLRALEGELARTIRSLNRVRMARVHLVLPKRQLFAQGKAKPSASIVLRLSGGLEKSQIRAVQHLVASAVKDLDPTRVSVVDHTGRLLADGAGGDKPNAFAGALAERTVAFEQKLKTQVEKIVGSVVGPGNTRVQVNAELDYNKITETSDTFDPESQVVRSTQTRTQTSSSKKAAADTAVTVANQLPGANETPAKENGQPQEQTSRTDETKNFEISRVTKTTIVEGGRVKRLSVAVLVDGVYNQAADGKVTYTPRPQEQLEQIAKLVRSAIGFNQQRGDLVEIANLRFAPRPPAETLPEAEPGFLNLTKSDYFHIAELAVLLLISLLVLLFVVRPLVRRILSPETNPARITDATVQIGDDGVPQLTGPDGTPLPAPPSEEMKALLAPRENKTATMMDVAQLAGEMQQESIRKAGEIVQSNPDEAVTVIRQWMNEQTA